MLIGLLIMMFDCFLTLIRCLCVRALAFLYRSIHMEVRDIFESWFQPSTLPEAGSLGHDMVCQCWPLSFCGVEWLLSPPPTLLCMCWVYRCVLPHVWVHRSKHQSHIMQKTLHPWAPPSPSFICSYSEIESCLVLGLCHLFPLWVSSLFTFRGWLCWL